MTVQVLYSSDGSDTLYTLNVEDFKELSSTTTMFMSNCLCVRSQSVT